MAGDAGKPPGDEGSKKKVIIDTDPGIDDAMAIFVALRSPELEVLGLTTTFGNVHTALATRNALHLLEAVGRTDIPVAEGSHVTVKKAAKLRIASFVHGSDGLGNQNFPQPTTKRWINQLLPSWLNKQIFILDKLPSSPSVRLPTLLWLSSLILPFQRRLGRLLFSVELIQLMEMSILQLRQIYSVILMRLILFSPAVLIF